MASLMDRAEQRKSLKRAGDADTDPASISASENTVGNDSDSANYQASDYDRENASVADAENTGGNTSNISGGNAADTAGSSAGVSHSSDVSENTGGNTGNQASNPARRNTSTDSTRRGPGRPAGPERRPLTVRVLAEHDQVLTEAWDEDGLRPQQVLDEALADWAKKRKRKRNQG